MEVQLHALIISALGGGELVSFTPRPLYPQGKRPRYPLVRRLDGLQSRSGNGAI